MDPRARDLGGRTVSHASLVALLAVGLVVLVGCALGLHRLVACALGRHRWKHHHARALWSCPDCYEEITQEQLDAEQMEITP